MKLLSRSLTALFLTMIYLLITMSPLAPLALKSPRLAHALIGECSGDCDICGCLPERRASHTCCCWHKKLKQQHDHEEERLPACCKKKQRTAKPVLTCNCPCGSNKDIGLWGVEKIEQIPFHFFVDASFAPGSIPAGVSAHLLTDRYGDPPDPPPKLMVHS